MKVCIGGTFNVLHKGHKLLINTAFQNAGINGSVFIGITAGEILKRKINVKSFEFRKKTIEQYLHKKRFSQSINIKSIEDKFGPSINGDFDAIVVSPETQKNADEINKKRRQIGKKSLEIIQIPIVLAEDGNPISSSRIIKNEIDENGKIIDKD